MHERFTRLMNGINPRLEMRWSTTATLAELRGTSVFTHLLGVSLIITVTIALNEPAYALGLDLLSRLVFFSLHFFPATVIAWFLSGWLFSLRVSPRVPPWVLLVIAGAITGLLLAPISVSLELLFGVFDASQRNAQLLPLTVSHWLTELGDEFTEVSWPTAIAWPVMNALVLWRIGGTRPRHRRNTDVAPARLSELRPLPGNVDGNEATAERFSKRILAHRQPELPRPQPVTYFLDKLPRQLGHDIVYLEAQEHYLRVVTSRAEHLLLYGLKHAVTELERSGFEGIQTHRSVWVAWKHVQNIDARLNSLTVKLSNGTTVKLGRRRAKDVLAAWQQRQNTEHGVV